MDLFLLEFMISAMTLMMVTFLAVLLMVYTFRNLLCWLRSAIMFRTSMREINGSGVRLYDGPDLKLLNLVGLDRSFLSVAWPIGVQLVFFFFFYFYFFFFLQIFSDVVWRSGLSIAGQLIVSVSPRFLFIMDVIMIYLVVHAVRDSPLGPNN